MANEENTSGPSDGSKSIGPVLDAIQPMHDKAVAGAKKKMEEPPPVPYFQQRRQAVQEAMKMAKQMNPIQPGAFRPGMLPDNPLKVFPLSHATQLLSFAKEHWDDSTANEYIQHLQAAHAEFVRGKEAEPAGEQVERMGVVDVQRDILEGDMENPPAQLPEEQVRTVE